MGTARVQAATVQLRERFVAERFGVDGLQRYRARCSEELRGVFAGTTTGWIDFDLFIEATVLIDQLFGRGDLALAWHAGRFAIEHEQGTWKNLILRQLRPTMIMGVARALWSGKYDGGRLMSRPVGPNAIVVSILDFPQPHRAQCLGIAGWMHGSLENGPRHDCEVTELSCRCLGGPTCDFRLTWEND